MSKLERAQKLYDAAKGTEKEKVLGERLDAVKATLPDTHPEKTKPKKKR